MAMHPQGSRLKRGIVNNADLMQATDSLHDLGTHARLVLQQTLGFMGAFIMLTTQRVGHGDMRHEKGGQIVDDLCKRPHLGFDALDERVPLLLVGSLAKAEVSASGKSVGRGVLRRVKVALIARAKLSLLNSYDRESTQISWKSFMRLLARPSTTMA
jgi:hypothetical protein